MSDAPAEDIEIKLDDTPAEPGAGDAKLETKVVEPEEGIEALKAQLAAEREEKERLNRERLAAQEEARRHAEAAARAQGETQDTNVELVTTAISSLKQSSEMAKRAYVEAMANQDFEAAANAQMKMAENAAKLNTLESGLDQLKAAPKPKAEASSDPIEQLAAQLTPKSAAWVRLHPECATDPRQYQRMIAAHNLAVTDGIVAESPEYFAAIERTLGYGNSDNPPSALSDAAKPSERRQSPPAAPVGRGGSSTTNTVRLSAEEREMAEMMGMSPQDYAKNKLALQREGKIH